jgi:hypothetical protein
MTLSSGSERSGSSPRRRTARQRGHDPLTDDRAPVDDALRLAVETLSAEICWFFANDARARGALGAGFTPASSRPPRA